MLISGMLFSWPSPSLPQLISETGDYQFTLEECSYLTVLPEVSMMIAGLFYPQVADRIGRKATLLSISLPYILSIVLTAIADNIYLFYVARLLVGVADACVVSTLPSYIGEIATPKVRGFWGNVPVCYSLVGHLFINTVGGYLDLTTTAWIMLLFPAVFLATFAFAPESPYFYLMKSDKQAARKVLQRLRGCESVDDELLSMEKAIERQLSEVCTWKELLISQSNRKGLMAATFLRTSQMLSGIACFATYNQYIFKKSAEGISAVNSAVIYSVLLLVSTLGALHFIDRLGRRIVIIVSLVGCGLSLAGVSSYFYVEQNDPTAIANLTWIPLAGMISYVVLYSFGLATVPTLVLGELFSAKAKAKALTVLIFVLGIWVGVTTKLFQVLDTNFGMYVPFAFFHGLLLL